MYGRGPRHQAREQAVNFSTHPKFEPTIRWSPCEGAYSAASGYPHRCIRVLRHFDELESHAPAACWPEPGRVHSRSLKMRFADHPAHEVAYR